MYIEIDIDKKENQANRIMAFFVYVCFDVI